MTLGVKLTDNSQTKFVFIFPSDTGITPLASLTCLNSTGLKKVPTCTVSNGNEVTVLFSKGTVSATSFPVYEVIVIF